MNHVTMPEETVEMHGILDMTSGSDDKIEALRAATTLLAPASLELLNAACAASLAAPGSDPITTLGRATTRLADQFVTWLRRLGRVTLELVAIEEIDTGQIVSTGGDGTMTNIDTSQRARYSVTAKDDRGFAADYELGVRASDPAVVSVEYFNIGDEGNTSNGTDAEIDQVLATFAGTTGTSTVEVFDPANPDVVLSADTIVANPGGVASAELSVAVIEEIPAPPEPEPVP